MKTPTDFRGILEKCNKAVLLGRDANTNPSLSASLRDPFLREKTLYCFEYDGLVEAVSELVRECKPKRKIPIDRAGGFDPGLEPDEYYDFANAKGHNAAIDEYEKNLLEALDPVSVTKAIENDSELTSD